MFDNQNPQDIPASASAAPVGPTDQPGMTQPPAFSLPPSPPAEDDLASIKNQALQSLTPLVDKLDQTPEEKFKTTMMLIQASDNASLIKRAYQAASQIEDEKTRAQALIDVINEINYFTSQNGK